MVKADRRADVFHKLTCRWHKAGLHLRRKHKRTFLFLALVLASSRFTRGLCLCLRRTCKSTYRMCRYNQRAARYSKASTAVSLPLGIGIGNASN